MVLDLRLVADEIAELILQDTKHPATAFRSVHFEKDAINSFEITTVDGQKFRVGIALILEGEPNAG